MDPSGSRLLFVFLLRDTILQKSIPESLFLFFLNLQVSEGDKGRDVVVVDVHGTRRDMGGHELEVLKGEELGLDVLGEDIGVLLQEWNNNGVEILPHVLLLYGGSLEQEGKTGENAQIVSKRVGQALDARTPLSVVCTASQDRTTITTHKKKGS